jgi:hypothetical protein
MSNTREGFEPLSVNDAVGSLLEALPDDGNKVIEERLAEEEETSVPQEAEAEVTDEDTLEMDSDSDDEDYADDSEDVEEYDDSEDEDEASQNSLYTVKVDGEEVEITLDELQKGYQINRTLTKRGQELAEQRKAFEAEAQQVAQMRDAYAQQLEQLSQYNQQILGEAEPDWDALAKEYSAEELFLYKTKLDQQKEQARQVEAERQAIAQQQAQEQQVQMQKHLAAQREEMLNRIPQWRDEDIRTSEREQVIKYAQQSVGFSPQEIANASDARAIELLYKAWQWDNLQSKKPAAKKKASQAPKMAKAGQPKTKAQVASRQRRQSLQRLNNERSVDAAVNYLMGN